MRGTQAWDKMDKGAVSTALRAKVLRFNGGLFADNETLPLDSQQRAFLIGAAKKDWRFVEPAIFVTLRERALDKRQRYKLGAHCMPRAYVERLVMLTVIEPLRADWEAVQAAALKARGYNAKTGNGKRRSLSVASETKEQSEADGRTVTFEQRAGKRR